MDLKPTSPSVLRRIGYGIMNLPKKVADYSLALQCLQKSQEICPSMITMHMLGTYYHRYAKVVLMFVNSYENLVVKD